MLLVQVQRKLGYFPFNFIGNKFYFVKCFLTYWIPTFPLSHLFTSFHHCTNFEKPGHSTIHFSWHILSLAWLTHFKVADFASKFDYFVFLFFFFNRDAMQNTTNAKLENMKTKTLHWLGSITEVLQSSRGAFCGIWKGTRGPKRPTEHHF